MTPEELSNNIQCVLKDLMENLEYLSFDEQDKENKDNAAPVSREVRNLSQELEKLFEHHGIHYKFNKR